MSPHPEQIAALCLIDPATTTFVVPSDPIWLGFEVYSQTASFVPGANPFGAITSNGITLTIGDL